MSVTPTRDMPRATVNRLVLPCIDCRTSLGPPPWSFTTDSGYEMDDVAECATCGLRYSGELLRTADAEAWAYVTLNRLFCREHTDGEHVVVVFNENGRVVPCPEHGPAR